MEAVVIFEEDTPLKLITAVLPDMLVKGGDYTIEEIVGHEVVLENGGEVKSLQFCRGSVYYEYHYQDQRSLGIGS